MNYKKQIVCLIRSRFLTPLFYRGIFYFFLNDYCLPSCLFLFCFFIQISTILVVIAIVAAFYLFKHAEREAAYQALQDEGLKDPTPEEVKDRIKVRHWNNTPTPFFKHVLRTTLV